MATVTVILPSVGRATLPAALTSCADADEIILVYDDLVYEGPYLEAAGNLRVEHVRGGNRGWTARNHALPLASGSLIAHMDDDDVYLPGAVEAIRTGSSPDRPTVFQVDCPWNGVVWKDPVLRFGNVSTQGIVTPNRPEWFGTWREHEDDAGGDYEFLKSTIVRTGRSPLWAEHVVAVLRPKERPAIAERYGL